MWLPSEKSRNLLGTARALPFLLMLQYCHLGTVYNVPRLTRSVFNLSKAAKSLRSSNSSSASQKYTITKRFAFPQTLIYKLVSRVDLYHEFIPYCTSSFITERDETTNEPSVAGLRVGFQAFDEEFSCNLECHKPEVVVAKSITHSVFHFLETRWEITPLPSNKDHCTAVLNLSYEFKSSLYNQVSALFAKKVSSLMVKAFERRAFDVSRDQEQLKKYNV